MLSGSSRSPAATAGCLALIMMTLSCPLRGHGRPNGCQRPRPKTGRVSRTSASCVLTPSCAREALLFAKAAPERPRPGTGNAPASMVQCATTECPRRKRMFTTASRRDSTQAGHGRNGRESERMEWTLVVRRVADAMVRCAWLRTRRTLWVRTRGEQRAPRCPTTRPDLPGAATNGRALPFGREGSESPKEAGESRYSNPALSGEGDGRPGRGGRWRRHARSTRPFGPAQGEQRAPWCRYASWRAQCETARRTFAT